MVLSTAQLCSIERSPAQQVGVLTASPGQPQSSLALCYLPLYLERKKSHENAICINIATFIVLFTVLGETFLNYTVILSRICAFFPI